MKTLIAIDPGKNGGIAFGFVHSLQSGQVLAFAMPDTDGDVLDLLKNRILADHAEGSESIVYLEHVGGYAGGAGSPGSAMFNFGQGFGFLKGAVMALGVRLELVKPQLWQKSFHLGTASACASKTEWKNKLKVEAQRRFPGIKVTLKTADALLILDWARSQEASR